MTTEEDIVLEPVKDKSLPSIHTIHGPHCGAAFAERDTLRRRVEERAHDCAQIEAERDRLRRELAERELVCQAHMELRYNAEQERDRLGGEAVELLSALRNLWRITDDCGRCTNMDETERAFEVLTKHLASASQADLSAGAAFSGPAEPSYGGTDE